MTHVSLLPSPFVTIMLSLAVAAAEPSAPETVARVGPLSITRQRYEAALGRTNVAAIPADQARQAAAATVLEQLVNEALLRLALVEAEIEADPQAIDAQVARLRADVERRGDDFAAALARSGQDAAALREQIALELGMKKFVESRVTPDVVARHFDQHRRELDGSVVRVSHIVLRPDLGRGEQAVADCLARATAIRTRILEGEVTFAAAVKAHSVGPSRRQDGDLGYIPRHGVAHDEFARQAFAIAKGDMSPPFITPSGVHVLRVTDVQPGPLTLARLRPQIEQLLVQRLIRDTMAAGRRGTTIEYAAGVPHFDPETPDDGTAPRRVVVGTAAER